MTKVALTGSICSGKTTACDYLLKMKWHIVDLDEVNRQLLQNSEILSELNSRLNIHEKFYDFNEYRDFLRTKLLNPKFRSIMENFLQPIIIKEGFKLFDQLPKPKIITGPFLAKYNLCQDFSYRWSVESTPEIQIQRITKRYSIHADEALSRLNLHEVQDVRMKWASHIIWNVQTKEDLYNQLDQLLLSI